MKLKKFAAAAVLTLLMGSAAAVPVRLDITFDSFPGIDETAFGMWETATAPSDPDLAFDLFIFDGPPLSSNPGIAFDILASSPIGLANGYAPYFSLGFNFPPTLPGVPYHFVWDLAPGFYTLIMADLFGDGLPAPGNYSLSVLGNVVGSNSGDPYFFERTTFAVPEPGTLTLLAIGLLGFGLRRFRR